MYISQEQNITAASIFMITSFSGSHKVLTVTLQEYGAMGILKDEFLFYQYGKQNNGLHCHQYPNTWTLYVSLHGIGELYRCKEGP